jgi:hypothetical protein
MLQRPVEDEAKVPETTRVFPLTTHLPATASGEPAAARTDDQDEVVTGLRVANGSDTTNEAGHWDPPLRQFRGRCAVHKQSQELARDLDRVRIRRDANRPGLEPTTAC